MARSASTVNKKAHSSIVRTKGHAFRGTTSIRRALPHGALVTQTALHSEAFIGSRYNGLTRANLLCVTLCHDTFLQQPVRATFDRVYCGRLPAGGLPSLSASRQSTLPWEYVFNWLSIVYLNYEVSASGITSRFSSAFPPALAQAMGVPRSCAGLRRWRGRAGDRCCWRSPAARYRPRCRDRCRSFRRSSRHL